MENVEASTENSPNTKQTNVSQNKTRMQEKTKQSPSTSKEVISNDATFKVMQEQDVDGDKMLSELKYIGKYVSPQQAVKDIIRCKVKSEATLASINIKLHETKEQDDDIQRTVAEQHQNVINMEAHHNLQHVQIQMTMEDFQTTPKLINAHKNDLQNIEARLNNAMVIKDTIDKKLGDILEKQELVKKEHSEKVEILTREIDDYKKNMEDDSKKRQEMLEHQRKLLADVKVIHEQTKSKQKITKENVDSKRRELDELNNNLSRLDININALIKSRDDLTKYNKDLMSSCDSLLNETKSNENALKDLQKSYEETEIRYQEANKELTESKNKNVLLSYDVKAKIEELERSKVTRQNILCENEKTIKKLQKQHEELKDEFSKMKDENSGMLEDLQVRKKMIIELENEYGTKKLLYDKMNAKRETDLAILSFAENEYTIYKERLDKSALQKEELQKTYEDLSKAYENKKNRIELFNKVKGELGSYKESFNKTIIEKSTFYEDSKKVLLRDFESFVREQESIVKKQEHIKCTKDFELHKLENEVKSLNDMAVIKKEKADEFYNNFMAVEKEVKELKKKLEDLKKNPKRLVQAAHTAHQTTDGAIAKQSTQKGILKSSETQSNIAKKVSFDPALDDSVCSEGSIERIFQEIFGGRAGTNPPEKSPLPEDLFDSMLRNSPPEKDKK